MRSYDEQMDRLFGLFEPLIIGAVRWLFGWVEFSLQPTWREVFLLMMLYLGARTRSYFYAGMFGRAWFRVALSFGVSLGSAVVGGLIIVNDALSNFWLAVVPMIGVALFDAVDAFVSAIFRRKEGYTLLADFLRYWTFAAPASALGIVWAAIACYGLRQDPLSESYALAMLVLFGFALMLAAYWFIRGMLHYLNAANRTEGNSLIASVKTSSTTYISTQLSVAIAGSILIVMFGT